MIIPHDIDNGRADASARSQEARVFHPVTALVALGTDQFRADEQFALEGMELGGRRHDVFVSRVSGSTLRIRVLPGTHRFRFARGANASAVRITCLGRPTELVDLYDRTSGVVDVPLEVVHPGHVMLTFESNVTSRATSLLGFLGVSTDGQPGWNPSLSQLSATLNVHVRSDGVFLSHRDLRPPSDSYLDREMYERRTLLNLLVAPGDRVAQTQAGQGFDTVRLSRAVGPVGRVFAFEAEQRAHRIGGANIELNGCENVHWLRGRFSSKEPAGPTGDADGSHTEHQSLDILCDVTDRLDLVVIEGPHVAWLIQRSSRLLKSLRPRLLLRISPNDLPDRDGSVAWMYESLAHAGYSVDHLDGRGPTQVRRSWTGSRSEAWLLLGRPAAPPGEAR